MSNPSSTAAANVTIKTFSDEHANCTRLNELDLADVFMKMDIGNTEFWGSSSIPWMTCFIVYSVLFYGALLILFCICVCLLFYAAREAYSLLALMYLLTTYAFWSVLSYAHGILIIYSIADDSGSSDTALAAVTRNLETITSSCFLAIIIVTFFSHSHSTKVDSEKSDPNLHFVMKANSKKTDSNLHFPLRYAVLSTLVIYLMAILIVIMSTPVGRVRFATLIFVALIIFRLLMFITSVLIVIVGISFKLHSLRAKEQFCNKLLVIALPYLLLSCTYFLYILATVVNNNNGCMEDIQLHRTVWLVFNSLLRLCEVSFSIVYFIKAIKLVKETLTDDINGKPEKDSMSSSFVCEAQGSTRRSMFYGFSSDADKSAKPVGLGRNANHSDVEILVENYQSKNLLTTEAKHPSRIANLDVEILSQSASPSPATSTLYQSVDSDRFLDATNFSDNTKITSNTLDGKAIAM